MSARQSSSLKSYFVMGACIMVLAMAGVLGATYYNVHAIAQATETSSLSIDAAREALNAKYNIVQIQQFLTDASLTGEMDSIKSAKGNLAELDAALKKISGALPEMQAECAVVLQGAQQLSKTGLEMVKAYLENGKEAGDAIMKRPDTGLDARSQTLAAKADHLTETLNARQIQARADLALAESRLQVWVTLCALFAAFCAAAALSLIYRRIRPLAAIISNVGDRSKKIQEVSTEINATSQRLAANAGTEASAAALTASNLEDIRSMVQRSSKNSEVLEQATSLSSQAVERGQSSLGDMLSAIQDIDRSNQHIFSEVETSNREIQEIVTLISEIGEKTKVINEIVFQTKLLSFNASVEAARAGEHGKGFAVVAEEVGNLAAMSGSAATEISEVLQRGIQRAESIVGRSKEKLAQIISQTRNKIAHGTHTAQTCGESFTQIVEQVGHVRQTSDQISGAIQEQIRGLEQIDRALNDFNQSTRESSTAAAVAEQSAALLLNQFNGLQNEVSRLRVIVTGTDESPSTIDNNVSPIETQKTRTKLKIAA
ncbi:MAG: hypothetical protein JST16_06130 [Bdellovibrionales bacterium]|nr:hypothetical protein [Bdellovibrionales bacterium]